MAAPSCSGRIMGAPQAGCLAAAPCFGRPAARPRRGQSLRAAAEGDKAPSGKAPALSSKDIGPIPFLVDNETFQDVMAFKGPAPERVNGRVAMWAFLICSLTEVTSGQSVLQQAAAHPFSASFLAGLISFASLAPKYVSGVALSELHEAASRDGLPENLRFFNKTHEIWLGRVAMLGLVGLAGLEVFLGHALFAR